MPGTSTDADCLCGYVAAPAAEACRTDVTVDCIDATGRKFRNYAAMPASIFACISALCKYGSGQSQHLSSTSGPTNLEELGRVACAFLSPHAGTAQTPSLSPSIIKALELWHGLV